MADNPNVFLIKSPEELKATVAEIISLIVNNHVRAGKLKTPGPVTLTADDVFINAHLVDRAGALLNACLASGYRFDALDWTVELDARTARLRGG